MGFFSRIADAIARERRAWRIRCENCGRDRPFSGGLRLWATSPVRKIGECTGCGRLGPMVVYHAGKTPRG